MLETGGAFERHDPPPGRTSVAPRRWVLCNATSSPPLAALSLMMTVQNITDTLALARELGKVAGSRLDRRVPEPRLDLLNQHTLAGQRRRVVAPKGMRMGEAVGHAGD